MAQTDKNQPLIGGHVSAAGGLVNAITNAEAITADTIQFFGSSPRQWTVRQPKSDDVAAFRSAWEGSRVKTIFLHAPYLVNLASSDPAQVEKSIEALTGHFQIAETIGAHGLIFHVGSGNEIPKEKAIVQVSAALKRVLQAVPGTSWLVIENSAGGGQKICSVPEEFKIIMDAVGSERMKVCIDTAHAFEAGIIERYDPKEITAFFDRWEQSVGLDAVVAFHVNDSKTPFNSHHDRHENIGEGHIGLQGFKNLANEQRIRHTSWMLEVPGFDNKGPDKKNIDILRSCFR